MKHPNADVLHAYTDGEEIQYWDERTEQWLTEARAESSIAFLLNDINRPLKWRIKPTEVEAVVIIECNDGTWIRDTGILIDRKALKPYIKFTRNNDTGEILGVLAVNT